MTKNPLVYLHFLSFSSSAGLNIPIIIVSSMYSDLAYYADVDFIVHCVLRILMFLILPEMTMLAAAVDIDQISIFGNA